MSILSTLKKLQSNDAVVRVEHTLWQAAAGAVVASLAATHGDVRVAVTAGVAAVLSAAKSLVSGYLAPDTSVHPALAVPAAPVVAPDHTHVITASSSGSTVSAPVLPVTDTPSTPAS